MLIKAGLYAALGGVPKEIAMCGTSIHAKLVGEEDPKLSPPSFFQFIFLTLSHSPHTHTHTHAQQTLLRALK